MQFTETKRQRTITQNLVFRGAAPIHFTSKGLLRRPAKLGRQTRFITTSQDFLDFCPLHAPSILATCTHKRKRQGGGEEGPWSPVPEFSAEYAAVQTPRWSSAPPTPLRGRPSAVSSVPRIFPEARPKPNSKILLRIFIMEFQLPPLAFSYSRA